MESSILKENDYQEGMAYERIEKEKERYNEKLKILKKVQSMLQLQKSHLEKSNIELRRKSRGIDQQAMSLSSACSKEVYDILNKIWKFEIKILKCKYSIQYHRCEKEKINNIESLRFVQTYLNEPSEKGVFLTDTSVQKTPEFECL